MPPTRDIPDEKKPRNVEKIIRSINATVVKFWNFTAAKEVFHLPLTVPEENDTPRAVIEYVQGFQQHPQCLLR